MYLKYLRAYEILNSDGIPTITIDFIVNYLAKDLTITTDIGYLRGQENPNHVLFDEDSGRLQSKGMHKTIQILESLKAKLLNFSLSNPKKFDDHLLKLDECQHMNII